MLAKIIEDLKQNRIHIPVWLGTLLSNIPYSWRPAVGRLYKKRINQIHQFEKIPVEEKKEIIFQQVYDIVNYSINNILFYKLFYEERGFDIQDLKSFDDINKIPLVSKEDLMRCELINRSNENLDKMLVNTGGSSGKTLSLYIEPSAIAQEQAHAHTMWGELGFTPSSVRLMIVGRSHVSDGVDYDFARNGYSLDMYQPFERNRERLMKLLKKRGCEFIQGYPSVVAGFAEYCKANHGLLKEVKNKLKGVFLISEFPYPIYRDKIEGVFQVPTMSHYGHTERCILAYEKRGEKNIYYPFQTYGYTEVKKREDGHYDLIGTAYYNHATPLIRYETGDIVDNPQYDNGLLKSFEIIEGRSGQFVIDKDGREISLTGLIMGRHHPLFDYCEHIQVKQSEKGKAVILYVPKTGMIVKQPEILFDDSNINMDFDFMEIAEPLRTKSGKVCLLVKEVASVN